MIPRRSLAESRPKELFTSYVPIWLAPVTSPAYSRPVRGHVPCIVTSRA